MVICYDPHCPDHGDGHRRGDPGCVYEGEEDGMDMGGMGMGMGGRGRGGIGGFSGIGGYGGF